MYSNGWTSETSQNDEERLRLVDFRPPHPSLYMNSGSMTARPHTSFGNTRRQYRDRDFGRPASASIRGHYDDDMDDDDDFMIDSVTATMSAYIFQREYEELSNSTQDDKAQDNGITFITSLKDTERDPRLAFKKLPSRSMTHISMIDRDQPNMERMKHRSRGISSAPPKRNIKKDQNIQPVATIGQKKHVSIIQREYKPHNKVPDEVDYEQTNANRALDDIQHMLLNIKRQKDRFFSVNSDTTELRGKTSGHQQHPIRRRNSRDAKFVHSANAIHRRLEKKIKSIREDALKMEILERQVRDYQRKKRLQAAKMNKLRENFIERNKEYLVDLSNMSSLERQQLSAEKNARRQDYYQWVLQRKQEILLERQQKTLRNITRKDKQIERFNAMTRDGMDHSVMLSVAKMWMTMSKVFAFTRNVSEIMEEKLHRRHDFELKKAAANIIAIKLLPIFRRRREERIRHLSEILQRNKFIFILNHRIRKKSRAIVVMHNFFVTIKENSQIRTRITMYLHCVRTAQRIVRDHLEIRRAQRKLLCMQFRTIEQNVVTEISSAEVQKLKIGILKNMMEAHERAVLLHKSSGGERGFRKKKVVSPHEVIAMEQKKHLKKMTDLVLQQAEFIKEKNKDEVKLVMDMIESDQVPHSTLKILGEIAGHPYNKIPDSTSE